MKTQSKTSNLVLYNGSIRLYGNFLTERVVKICDKQFTLFWTPHAQSRLLDRTDSCPIVASVFLRDILKTVYKSSKIVPNLEGERVSIRDFKSGLYLVLHISNTEKRIRVITCGNVKAMYPKCGDFVITRTANGNIYECICATPPFKRNKAAQKKH